MFCKIHHHYLPTDKTQGGREVVSEQKTNPWWHNREFKYKAKVNIQVCGGMRCFFVISEEFTFRVYDLFSPPGMKSVAKT